MYTTFDTVVGRILIEWTDAGINHLLILPLSLGFGHAENERDVPGFVARARTLLTDHLQGKAVDYSEVPLDLSGVSPFAAKIYETLRNNVGPGQLITYGQLALAAGSPGAARAVGVSMKRNPIPIIIPCHRVHAVDGPGGYSAGSGLSTKFMLYAIEHGLDPEDYASSDDDDFMTENYI